jgi:8-oxo-dGTP pyrophosphatase MutT (NUDIX family)
VTEHLAGPVADLLRGYRPEHSREARDVEQVTALVLGAQDPWRRSSPLHLTASALIVHSETGRILLRWHRRQQAWLQVGGHGDPGETDPLAIALREACEETGLTDLTPWPDRSLRHVVIVPVPAGRGEPAHRHADLRFVLATRSPESARPEDRAAALRWLAVGSAELATSEENLRDTIGRVRRLMAG